MKKRLILIILVVFTALTLFGCRKPKDENEIIIWWPSGKEMQTLIDGAIEEYKEINPDVTIRVVKKAGLDVYDAYKIAINDNNSRPDIAILDHVYVQALAHENLLADLSSMGSDTEVKSKYPENIYAANMYNGKNYGLPLSANTVVLMYNKNILADCGVTTIPTTFEELVAACEKVAAKNYIPFAQPINDSFVAMEFASYVARVGGSLVSDDYKTVKINSSAVRTAIDKWNQLSKYASQAEYEEGKFYTGKVAFIEMGSWNLSKVSGTTALFECGYTEMVSLDSSYSNYSGLGLYSFVVSEKSEVKEDAYDFIKFLSTDKEFQLGFAQSKDLLPVTNEALTDPYYTNDPALSVFAAQLQKVSSRPGTPIWPVMEKQIVNMLFRVVKAKSEDDIQAAINEAQNQCQDATNRKYN